MRNPSTTPNLLRLSLQTIDKPRVRSRVRFSLPGDETPRNGVPDSPSRGVPSPSLSSCGDCAVQAPPLLDNSDSCLVRSSSPCSLSSSHSPSRYPSNSCLSRTQFLLSSRKIFFPPSPQTPLSRSAPRSAHQVTSSGCQTTPHEGWRPCPASRFHAHLAGSHIPTPGSHDLEDSNDSDDSHDSEEDELDPGNSGHSQIPSHAPVTYRRSRGGNVTSASWQRLSQRAVKDLCKALQEYGRDSPYFRGLVNATLTGIVAVPAELKHLFQCLTSSAEYQLWEASWKSLLRDALPSLLRDPVTAADKKGVKITIDHLCGEGPWVLAPTQASDIPVPTLERVKEAAQRAFFSMQPLVPLPHYSKIFQGPNEPYLQFVEKLIRAVEFQVRREHAQEAILEEMAFLNANEKCRAAILSLPLDPAPTLQDMILVCWHKVPWMGRPESHQGKQIDVRTAAGVDIDSLNAPPAPRTPSQKKRSFRRNAEGPCFLCDKTGHWFQQCPLKKDFDRFREQREEGGNGGKPPKNHQKN
ncbi:hypothetical protein HGM15179_009715 [Zosterops borbonicus]|uniref:CCHC-type domain-containing protein n=1 Tax=Zosterops borbonicus TaxID=364589 RepID=A0A8K1LKU0_9PASS|nr:hypothetical protein HGM15179_009715 [Zosterops borbonicus]